MENFEKARIQLTLLYIMLSFLLLGMSNFVAVNAERYAFNSIEQALADKKERPVLTAVLARNLNNFDVNFIKILLTLDVFLVVLVSYASYILSGYTLTPIENMLQMQEEFSADASHELRTPLTTINMSIEALRRSDENLSQDSVETLDNIQQEVARMRKIVSGLLTLVRRDQASLEKIDLSAVLKTCCDQLRLNAQKKNIVVDAKINDGLYLFGGKDAIVQVVLNILDNAIKYTPDGGKVILVAQKEGPKIVIEISDTGKGIAKSELENVFKRFYRAHEAGEGLGLGLSIAKKIVEEHHGKLKVESNFGVGSTFSIIFNS